MRVLYSLWNSNGRETDVAYRQFAFAGTGVSVYWKRYKFRDKSGKDRDFFSNLFL